MAPDWNEYFDEENEECIRVNDPSAKRLRVNCYQQHVIDLAHNGRGIKRSYFTMIRDSEEENASEDELPVDIVREEPPLKKRRITNLFEDLFYHHRTDAIEDVDIEEQSFNSVEIHELLELPMDMSEDIDTFISIDQEPFTLSEDWLMNEAQQSVESIPAGVVTETTVEDILMNESIQSVENIPIRQATVEPMPLDDEACVTNNDCLMNEANAAIESIPSTPVSSTTAIETVATDNIYLNKCTVFVSQQASPAITISSSSTRSTRTLSALDQAIAGLSLIRVTDENYTPTQESLKNTITQRRTNRRVIHQQSESNKVGKRRTHRNTTERRIVVNSTIGQAPTLELSKNLFDGQLSRGKPIPDEQVVAVPTCPSISMSSTPSCSTKRFAASGTTIPLVARTTSMTRFAPVRSVIQNDCVPSHATTTTTFNLASVTPSTKNTSDEYSEQVTTIPNTTTATTSEDSSAFSFSKFRDDSIEACIERDTIRQSCRQQQARKRDTNRVQNLPKALSSVSRYLSSIQSSSNTSSDGVQGSSTDPPDGSSDEVTLNEEILARLAMLAVTNK
jgi:hypothetical protein